MKKKLKKKEMCLELELELELESELSKQTKYTFLKKRRIFEAVKQGKDK